MISLDENKSSFFQTEPIFNIIPSESLKTKRQKKPESKTMYSLSKTGKNWVSVENSPFKRNRLKPVILYNKEGDMDMIYAATRSFSFRPNEEGNRNNDEEMKEINKKLRENSDIHVCEDEKPKELIGEKAIIKYQDLYKHLDKILAENKSYGVKNSLITNMLSKLDDNRLLPLKMGVVKLQGKNTEINLK